MLKDKEEVNLKKLIEAKLAYFQEFIQQKNINIKLNLIDKHLLMSRYLADILLDNLIGNAIRHNKIDGSINIELSSSKLVISNTSEANALDASVAFERFYKSPSSEGMGLGLAIVKQTAELHQFKIIYSFEQNLHTFCLIF